MSYTNTHTHTNTVHFHLSPKHTHTYTHTHTLFICTAHFEVAATVSRKCAVPKQQRFENKYSSYVRHNNTCSYHLPQSFSFWRLVLHAARGASSANKLLNANTSPQQDIVKVNLQM